MGRTHLAKWPQRHTACEPREDRCSPESPAHDPEGPNDSGTTTGCRGTAVRRMDLARTDEGRAHRPFKSEEAARAGPKAMWRPPIRALQSPPHVSNAAW